jgi:hypothetical protein
LRGRRTRVRFPPPPRSPGLFSRRPGGFFGGVIPVGDQRERPTTHVNSPVGPPILPPLTLERDQGSDGQEGGKAPRRSAGGLSGDATGDVEEAVVWVSRRWSLPPVSTMTGGGALLGLSPCASNDHELGARPGARPLPSAQQLEGYPGNLGKTLGPRLEGKRPGAGRWVLARRIGYLGNLRMDGAPHRSESASRGRVYTCGCRGSAVVPGGFQSTGPAVGWGLQKSCRRRARHS